MSNDVQFDIQFAEESIDYDINVRVIAFAITSIFLILLSIYFIRAYSNKKQGVIQEMRIEASIVDNAFSNDLNYSKYFLKLITIELQDHYQDIKYMQKLLLEDWNQFANFNTGFGWKKYTWVNKDFKEVITTNYGIMDPPRDSSMRDVIENDMNWRNQIIFHTNNTMPKNNRLKLVSSIANKETGQYAGSLVLSYDITTMINRLNFSKRNVDTNFMILNDKHQIVAQSKSVIKTIVDEDETLSHYLIDVLNRIDFINSPKQEAAYLDMLSGANYFVKKVENFPFILIINRDSKEIKHNILESVIKKFIEVAIIASVFLVIIISIYKRETWLRSRAEKATSIANKAAKAKSDFLVFTAHEIRSPLGFILTGSELMVKELFGSLPNSYKDYARGIHQNSKVILDFITDILDDNQIIEGKFKIINSVANINDIIQNAIKVNKARFNKRDVKINFTPFNLPELICDSRRILQVMSNLISNAIKYSQDGTVINIKTEIVAEKLFIEIADQGIGMTEDEIQIALSTYGIILKKNHDFIESHGLGLPIVKMLLDAHDARLLINSKPNIGTKITIVFPKYKMTKLSAETNINKSSKI